MESNSRLKSGTQRTTSGASLALLSMAGVRASCFACVGEEKGLCVRNDRNLKQACLD